jgi:hypothetical protein
MNSISPTCLRISLVSLIIHLACTASQAQLITKTYPNGTTHKLIHTQGNDTTLIESFYENGKPEQQTWGKDSIKYYRDNGKLLVKLVKPTYKTDTLGYTPIGTLIDAESYIGFKESGQPTISKKNEITTTYYSFDGKIKEERRNRTDFKYYYPSGKLASSGLKNEFFQYDTLGNIVDHARLDTINYDPKDTKIWIRIFYPNGKPKENVIINTNTYQLFNDTVFTPTGEIDFRVVTKPDTTDNDNVLENAKPSELRAAFKNTIIYYYPHNSNTPIISNEKDFKDANEIAKLNENCMMGIRKTASKEWVIKPQFDSIFNLGSEYYACYLATKCSLYSFTGKQIFPQQYDRVEYLADLSPPKAKKIDRTWSIARKYLNDNKEDEKDPTKIIFVFKNGNTIGLIDATGKELFKSKEFQNIKQFDGKRLIVEQGELSSLTLPKLGLIDLSGKTLLPFKYSNIQFTDSSDFYIIEPYVELDTVRNREEAYDHYNRHFMGIVQTGGQVILPGRFPDIKQANKANSFLVTVLQSEEELETTSLSSKYGVYQIGKGWIADTIYHQDLSAYQTDQAEFEVVTIQTQIPTNPPTKQINYGISDSSRQIILPAIYKSIIPFVGRPKIYNRGAYGYSENDDKKSLPAYFMVCLENEKSKTSTKKWGIFEATSQKMVVPNVYDTIIIQILNATTPQLPDFVKYNSDITSNDNKLILLALKQDKWGILDPQGNIILDFEYDYLDNSRSGFGLAKNNKFAYYTTASFPNPTPLKLLSSDYQSVVEAQKKIIIVKPELTNNKGKLLIVDHNTQKIIKDTTITIRLSTKNFYLFDQGNTKEQKILFQDGREQVLPKGYTFNELNIKNNLGVFITPSTTTNKPNSTNMYEISPTHLNEGLINIQTGKIIIPANNYRVRVSQADLGIIWTKRDTPIEKATTIWTQYNETRFEAVDTAWQMKDLQGNQLCKSELRYPCDFNPSNNQILGIAYQDTLCGILNTKGKWILQPKYTAINHIINDKIFYTHQQIGKNDLVGLADSTGKVLLEPLYDEIGYFYGQYALVKQKNRIGLIDKKGRIVIQPLAGNILNAPFSIIDSLTELDRFQKAAFDKKKPDIKTTNHQPPTQQPPVPQFSLPTSDAFIPTFDSIVAKNKTILNAILDKGFDFFNKIRSNGFTRLLNQDNIDDNKENEDIDTTFSATELATSPAEIESTYKINLYEGRIAPLNKQLDTIAKTNSPSKTEYLSSNSYQYLADCYVKDSSFTLVLFQKEPVIVSSIFGPSISEYAGIENNTHLFYNYQRMPNNTYQEIKLNNLLNLSQANETALNQLIIEKTKGLPDMNLTCSLPNVFWENCRNAWMQTNSGITFYFPKAKDNTPTYTLSSMLKQKQNPEHLNIPHCTLTYEELKPFLK